jgi:high-affinity nickel-transport protein
VPANVVILRGVGRAFQRVRQGGAHTDEDFNILLNSRGFLTRIFRPLFRFVTKSWHMFPLGFLFGIGFETAMEVALLGISATQAAK